ncbi:vegetative cell wall protein gp1-like [Penaeus chinensis]|uniref:vegetative cell wall protein gp1-like n=1 Tax=Penaeus chinensis TaxID=139456 RepID=UPI001FB762B1|nr:vegetative cell wall protein gp1-like [Penaeus chinensis]
MRIHGNVELKLESTEWTWARQLFKQIMRRKTSVDYRTAQARPCQNMRLRSLRLSSAPKQTHLRSPCPPKGTAALSPGGGPRLPPAADGVMPAGPDYPKKSPCAQQQEPPCTPCPPLPPGPARQGIPGTRNRRTRARQKASRPTGRQRLLRALPRPPALAAPAPVPLQGPVTR